MSDNLPIDWPMVDLHDDGIRPNAYNGADKLCFYCQALIGQPHGRDCVIVKKLIRVRHVYEVTAEVPWSWDEDSIDFYYNEGSSCGDNVRREIDAYKAKMGANCDCPFLSTEFVEIVDGTPRRKVNL